MITFLSRSFLEMIILVNLFCNISYFLICLLKNGTSHDLHTLIMRSKQFKKWRRYLKYKRKPNLNSLQSAVRLRFVIFYVLLDAKYLYFCFLNFDTLYVDYFWCLKQFVSFFWKTTNVQHLNPKTRTQLDLHCWMWCYAMPMPTIGCRDVVLCKFTKFHRWSKNSDS